MTEDRPRSVKKPKDKWERIKLRKCADNSRLLLLFRLLQVSSFHSTSLPLSLSLLSSSCVIDKKDYCFAWLAIYRTEPVSIPGDERRKEKGRRKMRTNQVELLASKRKQIHVAQSCVVVFLFYFFSCQHRLSRTSSCLFASFCPWSDYRPCRVMTTTDVHRNRNLSVTFLRD